MVYKNVLIESKTIKPFRVKGENTQTINAIRDGIYDKLVNEYCLNVSVEVDKMGTGKLFDKTEKDCVVIKNLDHISDYNYFVFTFSVQGIFGIHELYTGGESKNAKRLYSGEKEHKTIAGMLVGSIRKAMVSDDSYEAEEIYYTTVEDAIRELYP